MRISIFSKILLFISFLAFMVCQVGGPILLANADVINSVLGVETSTSSGSSGGNYFDTKFNSVAELRDASEKIIEETMAEGAVLLKNENNALPLNKGDAVTMYGMASYYSVHTGQGSSGVEDGALDPEITVSLFEGLTGAGLNVNETLNTWYGQQSVADYMGGANFSGGSTQTSRFVVKDIPWGDLPDAKNSNAKAGIMVLARSSGEASDLYMDVTMDDGKTHVQLSGKNTNENYVGDGLSLTENEKSVLAGLKALKDAGTIDSIIVIMNTAGPMQCEFLDDDLYDIDACMWVGMIGSTGATAIGKLLVGDYNPSGKTTDTFFANSKYNPVYYNFGSIEYGNSSILADYFATNGIYNNKYYVVYQEGIYNGYKYTETRYEDYVMGRENVGNFDYKKVVSYPFGYGLSYSSFEYSNMTVTDNGNKTYTVTVDVTNTSEVTGKEAVQIYVQKPYTAKDIQNGVEKASVELVGFTKVEVPAGETVTASVIVSEKHFTAYDANGEKTYVIGSEDPADLYLLTAAKDSHDAINNILMYKAGKSMSVDVTKMYTSADRGIGNPDLVWGKYFAYDAVTYSTNEFIESENENFVPSYNGQKANHRVDNITNRFDDTDFTKSEFFSDSEKEQKYMSRNNWADTYGVRIVLTATDGLKEGQKNPVATKDNVAYPEYDQMAFYESGTEFDEIKLIYLRGKDYNDPLWDTLLNRMTWEEACFLLQTGLRLTNPVESIAAPGTSQQNGAIAPVHPRTYDSLPLQSGFRGFSEIKDPANKGNKLPVFVSNGIVAATYNTELIQRLGEQTGEEAIWAGFNGIYGLGVNIHRGA
jgi:beta-glucosidase